MIVGLLILCTGLGALFLHHLQVEKRQAELDRIHEAWLRASDRHRRELL